MEAVHELEAERDQQRQREEQEPAGGKLLPHPVRVGQHAPAGKGQPADHNRREEQLGEGMGLVVESGPLLRLINRRGLVQSE